MSSHAASPAGSQGAWLGGEHVLITGAGRGIGAAIAQVVAEAGASVTCLDRDRPSVEAVVAGLRESGAQARAVSCDLTSLDELRGAVDEVERDAGPLTVLVANAGGAAGERKSVLDMTGDDWQRMIDRNLTTAFNCGAEIGRRFSGRKRGAMVFITSFTAEIAPLGLVHYAAAKAAVRQLVRGLALELGAAGVRVNAVAPGFVLTEGNRATLGDPAQSDAISERVPLRRIGTPSDIAHAVVFLASSHASYITGTTLTVDGGWGVRE